MVMQACKLNLPHSSRSSLDITSLLFEPSSNTLALMQSDSSILLLPSLSPFSPPSPFPLIQPQTLIPPLTTSYCFIPLQSTPNSPNSRVLFAVAGPKDSKILLRFWILRNRNSFVKSKIICSQKGIVVDDKLGVLVDVNHGNSVKLVGSVNTFALYSISEGKIWLFGVKVVGGEEESVCVKLMKSVVVDCNEPVFSIMVSMGFLVLGESNGVRVIPLRGILKGRVNKEREFAERKEKKSVLPLRDCECEENGGCRVINGREDKSCGYVGKVKCLDNDYARKRIVETSSNRYTGRVDMNGVKSHSKLRSVKLKQDSNVGGTLYVKFSSPEAPCEEESSTKLLLSLRAVSIHSLSKKMFLILDSDGVLHLLGLYSTSPGSDLTGHMKRLSRTMKVQMVAVLPDTSTRAQTIWVSDGVNTVHVMSLPDMEVPPSENEKIESMEMLMQMQLSATEAVFVSEKVQNLAPLSTNAVLVLGQGTIFAYAIS